jgi:hypothetical protein
VARSALPKRSPDPSGPFPLLLRGTAERLRRPHAGTRGGGSRSTSSPPARQRCVPTARRDGRTSPPQPPHTRPAVGASTAAAPPACRGGAPRPRPPPPTTPPGSAPKRQRSCSWRGDGGRPPTGALARPPRPARRTTRCARLPAAGPGPHAVTRPRGQAEPPWPRVAVLCGGPAPPGLACAPALEALHVVLAAAQAAGLGLAPCRPSRDEARHAPVQAAGRAPARADRPRAGVAAAEAIGEGDGVPSGPRCPPMPVSATERVWRCQRGSPCRLRVWAGHGASQRALLAAQA